MFRERTTVLENRNVAPGHYVLRLASARIGKGAGPGQFVQMLCSSSTDPLLPRPFSFLSAGKKEFSILYQVVGRGTALLALAKRGDRLWAVGPLGNGFVYDRSRNQEAGSRRDRTYILVGGGVGIPPLYHLAQELLRKKVSKQNVHVFLGARDKALLLCEREFRKLRVRLHLATDNGSKGKKGFVTQAVEDFICLPQSAIRHPRSIHTCGPTPMLKAVSRIAQKYEIPCEVSVEEPMACGFGACLGCALKIRNRKQEAGSGNEELRFAMACSEGPVFQAKDIVWD